MTGISADQATLNLQFHSLHVTLESQLLMLEEKISWPCEACITLNMYSIAICRANHQSFHPLCKISRLSRLANMKSGLNRLFGESSGSVRLVGLDNLGTSELLVGVSRPDNLALGVGNDREGSEALVGTELAAPAGGDGEVTAGGGTTGGLLGGAGALDVVAALEGLAVASVDAELPVADGVVGAAVALGVADGPLGG